MNITKEEVQRVLEGLRADPHTADWDDAITLLQSKLAEPTHTDHPMRNYDRTCPACREDAEPIAKPWVGLTEQDLSTIVENAPSKEWAVLMTEATLKEKNT